VASDETRAVPGDKTSVLAHRAQTALPKGAAWPPPKRPPAIPRCIAGVWRPKAAPPRPLRF
jgi:hypothetical protein